MGQYHTIHNLDKQEYIHPHRIGEGLKLREFCPSQIFGTCMGVLLARHNGLGGGDFAIKRDDPMVGRWAGDRISIEGDYGDDTLYGGPEGWTDISGDMLTVISHMPYESQYISPRYLVDRYLTKNKMDELNIHGQEYEVMTLIRSGAHNNIIKENA